MVKKFAKIKYAQLRNKRYILPAQPNEKEESCSFRFHTRQHMETSSIFQQVYDFKKW
uniref:Uncharacterized protein n=1 Tax=Arion vulgaris TaxID=1028688 RepID=A0A0B6Y8S9_9EUPU